MNNISSDTIINNIKQVSDKYQEILFSLMQGKGQMLPKPIMDYFTDQDKINLMLSNACEQFLAKPETFMKINMEYGQKFQELVATSVAKFAGDKESAPLFTPNTKDRRFKDKAWQDNAYFDFIKQFYLMSSEWVEKSVAAYEFDNELKSHIEFVTQHFLNALAPSNFVFANPVVLRESLESGWQNIVQGLDNFLQDIKKSDDFFSISTSDYSAFELGRNIAATPGKVVMQNDLMQLICYEPKDKVHQIPILIIPPWINKYYILDLSPHNSLVKFLVDNNFQVFMVSWRNPDASLAHKSFEDYLKEGVLEPYQYLVNLGIKQINAAGYCIGGTLLATALAYMKKHKLDAINSATFITTLLDFSNPGEVGVFINEGIIKAIEEEMQTKGYFDGQYLASSFNLLRANDLIWSFFINNYLLGRAPMSFDLLYWNADSTNLPAKMHSYYLRNMYLKNLLKEPNKLDLLSTPIDLGLIDCPSFFLAASDDHIAPWQGVYQGMNLSKGDKTFCLTSSGHVAGVVNPPATSRYNYKMHKDLSLSSEQWLEQAEELQGSWWLPWKEWLASKSGELASPIEYKELASLEPAPGSYVRSELLR